MEAMSYGCPATSAYVSIHNMVAWMIDKFADQQLKDRYLPDLVTMTKIGSYCLTEPGSGSDAAARKTSARLEGEHYVLTGTKHFIPGGGYQTVSGRMRRTRATKSSAIPICVVHKEQPHP